MYFFRSIILILVIILASFMIYQYLSNKNNISKRNVIFIYLALIQGLFTLFSNNIIYFIFLDFSCFLGYMLKRNKEALVLSLVNILFFEMVIEIPWFYYLIYFIYFGINCLVTRKRKNISNYLLLVKAFMTSFVYFLYFEHSSLEIAYIMFILLYFYLLLELSYHFFRNYDKKKNEDNIIFQMAHEVKNPIAVCKGYLDMLDLNKQDKVNKYIPIVKSEMNRALTIMDDFLDLKRLTIKKDIMDLMLLLEDVSVTMDSILKNKDITLTIPKLDDEILLEADYDRLKQVFINLIKNSCEANSKKIKIDISLKKDRVVLSVIDDGNGIEEKDLKKIGTIFYTTKIKGTGIGVSLSKEIIKLHNGSIKYESKVKKGTKVIINLPYYMSLNWFLLLINKVFKIIDNVSDKEKIFNEVNELNQKLELYEKEFGNLIGIYSTTNQLDINVKCLK